MRAALLSVVLALSGFCAATPAAAARPSLKKAIWGPPSVRGVSQFPIYRHLGVGIYQMQLYWHQVAPARPARPSNYRDSAYRWPSNIDYAIREARRYRIRVAIQVIGAPRWANGNKPWNWAPAPRDFANFLGAASRRYRSARYWLIWGEPSNRFNFQPLSAHRRGRRLTRAQARAPRLYARMLDAAYSRLKRVDKRDLVVGGNTYTGGDIRTRPWIQAMRLPNGRRPRMDVYGHNPFSPRRPSLRLRLASRGYVDFGSLDTLMRWLDRYRYRGPRRRRLRLFLAEYTLPTGRNRLFNFWFSRRRAARYLGYALRSTMRSRRIYTLGWVNLHDEPPSVPGRVQWGLLDWRGRKKPTYWAYRRAR